MRKSAYYWNMSTPQFPGRARKLRKGAGLTIRDLARELGVAVSTVSRWERGENVPKRDDVEKLDTALGARGKLLRVWAAEASGSSLPPWMQDTARLTGEAVGIEYFSPSLVPGVLQCPEYAEVVFRYGQPLESPDEVRRLAAARSGRYDQLRRGRDPKISAVFPLSALTWVPEGPRRAQAAHLCGIIDTGRVTVCLIPEGTLLVGIVSPLLMMRLADGGRAATSDHVGGNAPLGDADLDRLDALAKEAYALAMPSQQSREVLGDMRT